MRRRISSGSVSGISLDSRKLRKKIPETARQALRRFPEVAQIRLFGSLAKGEENPLSDVDIARRLEEIYRELV